MKKIVLLLAVLLLCGCAKTTIPTATISVDDTTSRIVAYLLSTISDPNSEYQMGNGILLYSYDNDKVEQTATTIYPVTEGDKVTYLYIQGESIELIEVDDEISEMLKSGCGFVTINKNIYAFNEEKKANLIIYQEASDAELKKLRKINQERKIMRTISKDRVPLEIKDLEYVIGQDGKEYANNRIIVEFVSENNSYVQAYEKFCNGEFVSSVSNKYVFTFEALEDFELSNLLFKTKELNYVKDAYLDGYNEISDPSGTVDK